MHDLATIKRLNDEAAQRELGRKEHEQRITTVHAPNNGRDTVAIDHHTGNVLRSDTKRLDRERLGKRSNSK